MGGGLNRTAPGHSFTRVRVIPNEVGGSVDGNDRERERELAIAPAGVDGLLQAKSVSSTCRYGL